MQFVGGYSSFLKLIEDADAVADVLIYMRGEAEARRIAELKARMG